MNSQQREAAPSPEKEPTIPQFGQVQATVAQNINTWEFTEEEKARIRVELFLRDIDRQANAELGIMNTRWQIWTGAVTLVSLLSVIAAPAPESYVVSVAPWLLAFTAQYAGSGEGALKIIRKFFRFAAGCVGYTNISYEEFYDSFIRTDHGGGREGLRNTLVLCQGTITALMTMRLWQDLFALLIPLHGLLFLLLVVGIIGTVIIITIEGQAMRKTWWWLREPPKPQLKSGVEIAHG
jgi:hypothetical protein